MVYNNHSLQICLVSFLSHTRTCICFLKKASNFFFNNVLNFSYSLRNLINLPIIPSVSNKPYFLHFFFFKLFHINYRHNNWFKNSSCIYYLIFTLLSFNSLSFNSVISFSNSKRLSLPLKFDSLAYCLNIFSQYFRFHNFYFPSSCINKKVKIKKKTYFK